MGVIGLAGGSGTAAAIVLEADDSRKAMRLRGLIPVVLCRECWSVTEVRLSEVAGFFARAPRGVVRCHPCVPHVPF